MVALDGTRRVQSLLQTIRPSSATASSHRTAGGWPTNPTAQGDSRSTSGRFPT